MAPRPFVTPSLQHGCGGHFTDAGYEELIVPAIWERDTFVVGEELANQRFDFTDKGGRAVCLVPEITALVRECWRTSWSKTERKPCRVFYIARCYRYDRPQAGRYREFTQVGIELLGGRAPDDRDEALALLAQLLDELGIAYALDRAVQRGLAYYVEDGFEARCDLLGAQKQIAGGGRYAEGIGWALGLDRLLLAIAGTALPP